MSSRERPLNSDTNHGPVVNVVTWVLLVATTLALITRTWTKISARRKLDRGDMIISIAFICSVGQSIAICIAAANGLGQYSETLTQSSIQRIQQSDYASNLLYVWNLCLAKISIALLLKSVTPVKFHSQLILALIVLVSLWTVSAEFTAAFQCTLPHPWRISNNTCINRILFWNLIEVFNIVGEIGLMTLPVVIIWQLQTNLRKKMVIVSCFLPRLVFVAAVITRLVYLNRLSHTHDATFHPWLVTVSTQTAQNLSIITACIPSLKPFLESLESGMLGSDHVLRHARSSSYGYNDTLPPIPKPMSQETSLSNPPTKSSERRQDQERLFSGSNRLNPQNLAVAWGGSTTELVDWESQISGSKTIRQTRSWVVE